MKCQYCPASMDIDVLIMLFIMLRQIEMLNIADNNFYVFDRQFKMLSSEELSDFGCFLMLASGVILLQQTGLVRESSP